ncbi:hypothetical protein APQ14_18210 [Vibrio toranzoniae]|uniref:Uncharacterized protein n=1 Tax=Vibrio toranzoniae TaxID=1194427 RepID=A0A109DBZ7_9VIBR|nr:hypothetical protein [Vibrio toranzoniae]KWU02648.1 hypothetical protein APQ14_18210 [Vibrio toranzoniae]
MSELIEQEVNYKQRSRHIGANLGMMVQNMISTRSKVANEAMYQATHKGKGQFVFSDESE